MDEFVVDFVFIEELFEILELVIVVDGFFFLEM
jgi:hypothetical protein